MNEMLNLINEAKEKALSQPKYAFECARRALELAKVIKSKSNQANAYFYMAFACRVNSEYINGLSYAFQGLAIAEELKDDLAIMKIRNIIGIIYFYYGDYASALENFMIALERSDGASDPNMYTSVINNIGEIYREAKEYTKALEYYSDALEMAEKHKEIPQLELNSASIYLNISDIYFMQKKHSDSIQYIKRAYVIAQKYNNTILVGESETKLGRAMLKMDDYAQAQHYFSLAGNRFSVINNKFYNIELLLYQAELEEVCGRSPLSFLDRALKDAAQCQLDSKASRILKEISDYYEKEENYQEALKYYKFYSMKEKEIEATNLSQKLELVSLELENSREKKDHRKIREVTKRLRKDIIYIKNELDETRHKNFKLIKDTMIDELTKAYNRRGIQHFYNEFMSQHLSKDNCDTAIFMIDIDFFKAYNDSLGHLEGDQCLKKVAHVLKKIPMESYIVGRFGGEEFIVLAQVCSHESALALAEDMRKSIEELKLEYDLSGRRQVLTISIGVYLVEDKKEEMLQAIDYADQALYNAKEQGRNRVCIYG